MSQRTLKTQSARSLTGGESGRNVFQNTDQGRFNPVQMSFQQELSRFLKYVTRKAELGPRWRKPDEEAYARGSNTLFNLWNNFEQRLPHDFFVQQMIATGDYLVSIREYKIAQCQCYGRYLSSIRGLNTLESCSDYTLESFNNVYLPSGIEAATAEIALRALLGESISSYHVVIAEDPKLQNPETVSLSVDIMKILRLITQAALHKESFCWLVFNGTVHIYSISRHLMALGYSNKVLEFLQWACMCMESSVPLMTVRYLIWRSTLYAAACQCYYDMKAANHAESFARRGLTKVNELEDIERMSTSDATPMVARAFRQAKTRMQVMVFKRVVFETRKRPKGLLRPKTKPNLKDTVNQPWPRTPTERLLADQFTGTAAQFLAILEALSEPNRRTLHCEAPASDAEDTITDVCAELFFAGMELIAGGGGPRQTHAAKHQQEIHPSVVDFGAQGLMALVQEGSNGIPLQAVVKFVKQAFSYEQWETFNTLISPTLELLKQMTDSTGLMDTKTLELMAALEPFFSSTPKPKKAAVTTQDESDSHTQGKGGLHLDDLMKLADTLHSCSVEPYKSIVGHMDPDMVIDAALFLWSKCKIHFQRVVSSSMEGCKFVLNDQNADKWVHMITVVHTALSWSDACTFDPILFAEVALKLALVLECKAANLADHSGGEVESPKPALTAEERKDKVSTDAADKPSTPRSNTAASDHSLLLAGEGYPPGVRGVLTKSRDILRQAYEGMVKARDSVIDSSGETIADIAWIKSPSPTLRGDGAPTASLMDTILKALHMELLFVHHRVALKLVALGSDPRSQRSTAAKKQKPDKSGTAAPTAVMSDEETELMAFCGKNPMYKALLLMHQASRATTRGTEEQTQLLKESMDLIQKAQQRDRKLASWNRPSSDETAPSPDVPPAPLLLYRSPSVMIFRPAPYSPKGETVAWYRLFGRSASGHNVKVRLNDYQLPGTGEEIPATDKCRLMVKSLVPNEKYVFAVAAYNRQGQLIGKTIGSSSRPVLATHPLPTLMAWGYLAQTAYIANIPSVAKVACTVLWDHFVTVRQPTEEELRIKKADSDIKIKLKTLNEDRLFESSPILVRQFLQTLFISVDFSIREGFLYCNSLSDSGPLYNGQVARLAECERLLLAVQVAGWLNDTALSLQAIVQCYGLLAPMVHQQIAAKPVIQILLRCHAVLQEVPSLTRHRRQTAISDSLSHMIATMTYFIAKTLHSWGEPGISGAIIELGKKMLNLDTAPDSAGTMTTMQAAAAMATANMVGGPPGKKKPVVKKPKPPRGKAVDKDTQQAPGDVNLEEMKALEAYIMKLSQKALHRDDEELMGTEDPNLLYSYIASLPTKDAYFEVLKFKRRTRFLGFFVQVLSKAIDEGMMETALDWTHDAMTWVIRRNELLLANKPTIVRTAATAIGPEDEKIKKFAMAIVEFGKPPQKSQKSEAAERELNDPDEIRTRTKLETARTSKPKSLVPSIMSRKARKYKGKTDEEINFAIAVERMQTILPDFWRSSQRRRKLRSVSNEELPWRVQLNYLTAICNMELFLDKTGSLSNDLEPLYRPSLMDPDWFSFATSGTFITSWAGTSVGHSPDPFMGFSGYAMDAPPYASPAVTTGHHTRTMARPSQPATQAETLRAGSRVTAVTSSEKDNVVVTRAPLFYLGNVFSNLCRSIVLAHRGRYWAMLQNACRSLWNATQTVLQRVSAGLLRLTDEAEGAADIDLLRAALWRPFFTAVDCLLDMMVHLQDEVRLDADQNKKREKLKAGDLDITESSGLMGGVEDERGGASLRFEIPLDNTTILDARWLRRLVMYTVEMLFYEQKWERTVDIALRFNALSRSRYAETLMPVVVVAQRKLMERINAHGGPCPSQPHITICPGTGTPQGITIKPTEYMPIEPAVHIDPEGHNVYSGSTDAMRLVSVPLDVGTSLQTLREALDTKHHTARVLEHSRQLLLSYLAGQQDGRAASRGGGVGIRRGSSRVGFVPAQVKPPTDVPPDLSEETFDGLDDIRSYTLQPAQLAVVISSYDKTIEMLQFRQQRSLAAQAMHELGNIMFHSGNIRAAYKWWAEALDTILNTQDCLKTWRDIVSGEEHKQTGEVLLQRCGIWGCLLAGVLAANIAQYIHTSNLGLRQECCLLSAALFKALLRSSLPHPTDDKDYALYEIGAGHGSADLLPGVDLLSDVFRSDGRSVVASLRWVAEELARAQHLLTALPLVSLCLYFTSRVCRDVQRTVDVRILRVRILTDLGMFADASKVLSDLLIGDGLPRTSDDGNKSIKDKQKIPTFNNRKQILDPGNIEVLNELLERRLTPALSSLYGQPLSGQLSVAHAHLLVALSSSINVIADDVREELQRYQNEKEEAEVPPTPRGVMPPAPSFIKKTAKQKSSDDTLSVKSSFIAIKKKLLDAKNSTSLPVIKGFLLFTAESMLDNLCDSLTEKTEEQQDLEEESALNMSPSDLELLVLAKLELSAIARQCHHSVTSASLVYSAMRTLEDVFILSELDIDKRSPSLFITSPIRSAHTTASPTMVHYLVAQARCRLDARLWLTCRLALALSLSGEDSGMGKLGGTTRSVTSFIGSCDHHCRQGLDESEAFGDVELTAQFSMLETVHALHQGKVSQELLHKLEDVIAWLERSQSLSFSGQQLLAMAVVQFADIGQQPSVACDLPYLKGILPAYKQACDILLGQLLEVGESIDLVTSSPVLPLKNLYLSQLPHIVDIKLRLGRALARNAVDLNANVAPAWGESVRELELGLGLARGIAYQRQSVEAQLLFSIGQIQRQMFCTGATPDHVVPATLVEAIKKFYSSEHDLVLMRQAYLEIALTYLHHLKQSKEGIPMPSTPPPAKTPRSGKQSKGDARNKKSKELQKSKEMDHDKRAAWIAIRAAGIVAMAIYRLRLLTGDPDITALKMSENSGRCLPSFALYDLLGTDDVVAPGSGAPVGQDGTVVMGTTVNSSDHVQITWIHLLGYLSYLRRQCSYISLGVSSEDEDGPSFGPVAFTPVFSNGRVQKLAQVHTFLKNELAPYASECCGVYPGEALVVTPTQTGPQMVVTQARQPPVAAGEKADEPAKDKQDIKEEGAAIDSRPSQAGDLEVCVQWYKPELNTPLVLETAGTSEQSFVCLYALNQKAFSQDSGAGTGFIRAGLRHVSEARLQALHDLLIKTLEMAENELQPTATSGRTSKIDLPVPEAKPPGGTPGRKRRTMGIRALSARQRKDDNIRAKLKEHIADVNALISPDRHTDIKDVPFEVTVRNVTIFEAMFDPSRGYTGKSSEAFFSWISSVFDASF
ncbi:cilia- and flagella-associated protein 54 isoform X1 [Nematostella vectensis]|uniref:cilia- and flagella-associated protein 54 isoform X1 n=1 Tax=Nematostella vectensis TaxID=45351 RepID=UPI002076FAEF|nr:cilia- and flagella-associated protein 54 isoform X1 [Nematostella vectensis]